MVILKENENQLDYFSKQQQRYYELDENYFWVAAHCDSVMASAGPLIKANKKLKELVILDAGCGTGNLVSRLLSYGKIIGIDASFQASLFCHKKYNIRTSQALVENIPFSDNTFDFIFVIDVIEHVKDGVGALKELYRILKPGGFLIVTVPAFMCLWGYHDKRQGHFRRYSKYTLHSESKQAGFILRNSRYFNFLLFPPLFIIRQIKKISTNDTDDFFKISPVVNKLLHKLLDFEIPFTLNFNLPFGSSLLSILYKDKV